VPPTSAVAVLAPGADVPLPKLVVIMFTARLVRFLILGMLAARTIRFHFVT